MKKNVLIVLISLFLNFLIFSPVLAFEFDPENIISDFNLTNRNDLSWREVQQFLLEKGGKLAYYETMNKEGDIKMASQIICDVANKYLVSKRFLLVMLQKEQGLITDLTPSEKSLNWATGYGICDNCSMDDPAVQRWKGFAQQVASAAAQFRDYMDNPNSYEITSLEEIVIDGQIIKPENQATAALYIYTPHIASAKSFARIWNLWFGDGTDINQETVVKLEPEKKLPYPEGTLLKLKDSDDIWYIFAKKKNKIISKSIFLSRFQENQILTTTKEYLDLYPVGFDFNLYQYSLVKNENNEIFLIVDNQKRKFSSEEVIKKIGYNPEEIINVKNEEIINYKEGLPITEYSTYPIGALLQNKETGAIFYVEAGKKYLISDAILLKINFSGKMIVPASPQYLNKFMTGAAIKIRDGELVKTSDQPAVYAISGGKKLPFVSAETFESLGYKWEKIITISTELLNLHETGEVITLNNKQ